MQKEKIGTDRRRKHFFHTFLYLLGEWTNQRYVPKHSVVSKTPDSKIGVVGSTSLPEKRGRFTENLSIYLSSPAPNSPLQNPSNFGATASHWPLYILLFFFFLILTGWMRGALCVATRLYILYLAADESISGWEFLLLIPKSPQVFQTSWNWYFSLESKWHQVSSVRQNSIRKHFFFYFNVLLRIYHTFLNEVHMICTYQPLKI